MPDTNTNEVSTLVLSTGSVNVLDSEAIHPTQSQYDAMRSGVSSSDVTQITTNATNIALIKQTLEGVL